MLDLVSIIVPIYNVENYIEKCIRSIINQSYDNIEIILVDDGSTDKSGCICDKYKDLDCRVIVLHKKNGGLVSARKAGLEVSNGKYICFVDGDDYIEKETIESYYYEIEKSKSDMVHFGYFVNDENVIRGTSKNKEISLKSNKTNTVIDLIFNLKEGQKMSPCLCFKIFDSDLIKECYAKVPDEQSYGEDLIALCHAIFIAKKISICDKGYYHYVVRPSSIMNSVNKKHIFRENELRRCLISVANQYNALDEMENVIDTYWLTGIIDDLVRMIPEAIRCYQYPNPHDMFGKKVVLYGAGKVGRDYYQQLSPYSQIEIVEWIDKNPDNVNSIYRDIRSPDALCGMEFDCVLIGVLNESLEEEISSQLINMGISKEKIIWCEPVMVSTMV